MTTAFSSFEHSSLIRHPGFDIRHSPALQLFLAAFCLRLAVFLTASHLYHIPLTTYANKGDGESYLAYARAILGDPSSLTDYHRRVFPGYPTLIVLVHLVGFSLPLSALLIDWLSSGIAAAAGRSLFGERRIGWAMLFLLPHYLANSSLAMSEAPLLAFTLMGLLLAKNNRLLAGGILLGFAGLIRPMACFAAGGLLISFALERRWRQLIWTALAAAAVVIAGIIAMHLFTGDAFRGVRIYRDSPQAYVGRIFEWPFHSLVTTPLREHVSPGFISYIYIHVAIVLFACVSLGWRILQLKPRPNPLDLLTFTWLVSNTLFQLCIGSGWGFRHFPRFAIPAQPALFWALHSYAPRQNWIWLVGIAGVFVLAVVSVHTCP
jgi:hypothetical protein